MGKDKKEVRIALLKTVKNFQRGSGFWIADFRRNKQENFKMDKTDKISFDFFLPGTQETKEAKLLSRMYEFWINPKYRLGVFFLSEKKQKIDKKLVLFLIPKIIEFMNNLEIRWSWLFLFKEEAEEELKELIKNLYIYRLGIILCEVKTLKTYYSSSFLCKEGKKLVKFK